ncbi:MAG TPA: AI-2E family transporter [Rubrobacteraceae bacterium]|nr:AI-2E family transporter [Rubrobacteraceae bacterium]
MYAGIGMVFAILLGLYFFYQAREVVLVFLLTLLVSTIVSGPVDYLARKGMGRGLGTLIVMIGLALVLGLAGFALGSVVEDQVRQLIESFPTLLADIQDLADRLQSALGLEFDLTPDPQQLFDSARNFLSGETVSTVVGVGANVVNILSMVAVVLVATIFAVVRPAPLVNGFVALFPAGQRERVREILEKMYEAGQKWVLGQLTAMVIIGVLFTIALSLIGVPFALLLGILAGLLAFIPFIGPLISIIPPVFLALTQNPVSALFVVLAYVAIQAVESNLIHPLVMSRAVSLHPAVIVFALLIMGTLFGLVGIVLAIPLFAALAVLVRELWIKQMDEKGTDPNPPEEDETTMEQKIGQLQRAVKALFRRS